MKHLIFVTLLVIACGLFAQRINRTEPIILKYNPLGWKSDPPKDIPFKISQEYKGIRFLASDESANITATDIRWDGGYCVQGVQPK